MPDKKNMTRTNLNTGNNEHIDKNALEILKDTFENTNRWLQFAETKNGALIGVNGLFLFKSVDYLFEILNGKLKANICIVGFMTAVFFLAIILALKSFFPNTSVTKEKTSISENDDEGRDRILIFYGNICMYQNPSVYLRDIYKYYLETNVKVKDLKKMELDYAKEILINSRITSYKYRLFKLALKLNFIAIIIFCVFLVIA